jgi:bifunctional UDP-N-acetylglucosamine pyrophosphorylase / glucosamine-1-phosphate N-acetyltransferase
MIHTHDHSLVGVVMAVGDARAMLSNRPKALHRICGRTLAGHALATLAEVGVSKAVVVVSSGVEYVSKVLLQEIPANQSVEFVTQSRPDGSADAAAVAITALDDDLELMSDESGTSVLFVSSDRPLVRASSLAGLVARHLESGAAATLMTAHLLDPDGHGRVVRGRHDRFEAVLSPDGEDEVGLRGTSAGVAGVEGVERSAIGIECDAGVLIVRLGVLAPALRRITRDTDEFGFLEDGGGFDQRPVAATALNDAPSSLSDVLRVLGDAGYQVATYELADARECEGVDDRLHLAEVEGELRRRTNERLMAAGVTMLDPAQTYVDATVKVAADVTLFPGTMLQGRTVIHAGAEIGPNARLVDTVVGEGAVVESSVCRSAVIGAGAVVGPFAALEPGSKVGDGVRTGPGYRS